jgi:hypothetical protein
MNNKWNSIIEVIVVIIILTIWIIWAYNILNTWQKLNISTENRIKAINIAREWIEAVTNIRDTNWLKFSSDYINCWNTLNYDLSCIWNTSFTNYMSWSYKLSSDWFKFTLSWTTYTSPISFGDYKDIHPVYFDANGLVTQSWSYSQMCNSNTNKNCISIFSREVRVRLNSNKDKMTVNSIVKWVDNSRSDPYEINLETILTNWKTKF